MITSYPTCTAHGLTMPSSWTDAVTVAAVRTPAEPAVTVRTLTPIADVFVLEDDRPGTSAWSPPI
jgi:hypothetical protein